MPAASKQSGREGAPGRGELFERPNNKLRGELARREAAQRERARASALRAEAAGERARQVETLVARSARQAQAAHRRALGLGGTGVFQAAPGPEKSSGEMARDDKASDGALPAGREGLSRQMLHEEGERLRASTADVADALAFGAEAIAATFEDSTAVEGRERRAGIAAAEREVAAVLRRNAARLRRPAGEGTHLEPLPHLPLEEGSGDHEVESSG